MKLDIRWWGNSKAIRLPKKLLKEWDRKPVAFDAEVKDQRLILTPIFKEQKALDVLFKDYVGNKDDYPFEIVDKGGSLGKES
ncbi:AbrB/MazE/SpoVT family DNA-binding domain-containing protein [Ligilactobacillus animalis]|uniref:SpoVT-AbrB domain-containing protein n=1 Tax=Ligilactobacillus animalis TaxID=1605 RepID=A0AAJ6FZ51_9LACO|nr:hypothetical protein [Ligilactobacillus animalis]MDU8985814.1 hypothetical protein [Ligilactobacillus animalis]WHQ80656.1 hypothetical protein QFF56_02945 [Ligilactobacillus animalis]